ncbi:hypothetical protein ACOSQ4_013043 [Xanthoceras sorbifolium]
MFLLVFLSEFQDTLKAVFVKQIVFQELPYPNEVLSWILPSSGSFKLNTDVVIRKNLPFVDIRAAICDCSGRVIAAISKYFPGSFSADSGETLALREGLLLAQDLKLVVNWVEYDANNVIKVVHDVDPNFCVVGLVVNDIKTLCKVIGVVKCQSISRKRSFFSLFLEREFNVETKCSFSLL